MLLRTVLISLNFLMRAGRLLYANISISDKHFMAMSLLPTQQDDQIMRDNISKLVLCVLVTHLNFFKLSFDDLIE